jgi:hypothetical protein
MLSNHLFPVVFLSSVGLSWASPFPACKTLLSAISVSSWSALNASVAGALLSTAEIGVPGGICHPGQPNYNSTQCPELQDAWFTTWDLIVNHPVHNVLQNWNNDSCWPFPDLGLQCTLLLGYPTYVVNATNPNQVSAAIDFARETNVRLIVKSSGHDFRARSVAGNSLSIWVHNMRGLELHKSFSPSRDCSYGKGETAITWAAGESALTKFTFAHEHSLMVTVGGGPTVSTGFALGGGHGILSATHVLAADNILEVNIITPDGKLVTANACQDEDLFWAVRGGGGSTFGVVLNVTEKAYPETALSYVSVFITGIVPSNANFFEASASFLRHSPAFANAGLMAYAEILPRNGTTASIFVVEFLGVNQTQAQTEALVQPIMTQLNATYLPQGYMVLSSGADYATVYDFWINNLDENGSVTPIGVDEILGSRLLNEPALTRPDFPELLQATSFAPGGSSLIWCRGLECTATPLISMP